MKSSEVRKKFIEFFKNKQHTFVSPSAVISQGDPTLMFTNAGMNQFKDVFLGTGSRDYNRAVNSQVCIRVSGKHNDLEDVGRDNTHLTSFEMLGNWSFGDYYKKEAITWAWELYTDVFNIPKDHLYATVFEEDDESLELWKRHTDIDHSHIVKCDAKDNFWEMGKTGPCGPCSEIHVDLKPGDDLTSTVDQALLDTERFTELWNLVFIQYNRDENGELKPLPQTHVDTGAGLERLVSYLQKTYSNYQTDLFSPILEKIEAITGSPYQDNIEGMAHRVLADHCRTLVFGIADNALPSNEGRGYVLRRLLRRALRYSQKLGIKEPILYKLVDTVIDNLGDYLTHLPERRDFIKTVIKAEEESFLKTLELGLQLFSDLSEKLKKTKTKVIPGEEAFKLYDTFGFPLDLTEVLATEQGFEVDIKGFNNCLDKQKKQSRESTLKKQKEDLSNKPSTLTNDHFSELNLHLSEYVNEARGGEARVLNDPLEKVAMARHHSVTHLLHQALRDTLGDHVQQAGSLVDIDRLRFDFSHFNALNSEQLKTVEDIVNKNIKHNTEITVGNMTLDEAKDKGAMALFGEKYDENNVRLVSIGEYSKELCGGTHVKNTGEIEVFKIIQESAIAAGTRRIEAIAGRDVFNSFESQEKNKLITLIKNRSVKMTSLGDDKDIQKKYNNLDSLSIDALKLLGDESSKDLKRIEKTSQEGKQKQAGSQIEAMLSQSIEANNLKVCAVVTDSDMATLKATADQLTANIPNMVAILAGVSGDKGFFVVKIGSQVKTIKAPDLITVLTSVAGGKGGGRPDFAQAGGASIDKLEMAIVSAKQKLLK
ncbi:alanine--tRNA ligase [Candidatus Marinamargulisbacteria bacterium SCGC AAA071-K20]|nr:alanine--tRNA ligase [Candidatus Marinamargulisbacteria bacterium SCGC AAA071-K20]